MLTKIDASGGEAVVGNDTDDDSGSRSTGSTIRGGNGDNPSAGGVGRTGGIFGRNRDRTGSEPKPSAKAKEPLSGRLPSTPVEKEPELKQPGLKKPEATKTPKLDLQTFANVVTVGLFNSIAIATAHEHWLKSHEEVLDFTVPLVAWANQLPLKTIKKIENNLAPMATIVGLYSLLAPDIAEEVRIRNEDRRSAIAEKAGTGKGIIRTPGRSIGVDRTGSVGTAGGDGNGSAAIPGVPSGHSSDDFGNV